jgi:hypothetical protein
MTISDIPYYNYWVFGLHPSSGILKTREQKVLENGTSPVSET